MKTNTFVAAKQFLRPHHSTCFIGFAFSHLPIDIANNSLLTLQGKQNNNRCRY